MSNHNFHEIYLHINQHTKYDEQLITPQLEPVIYQTILQRCINQNGVYLHGVGGTETHIHIAINIEPVICISDFIGKLKGGCSHDVNEDVGRKVLEWQRGFAPVSFAKSQLEWVLEYIRNQKKHHARGTLSKTLERTADDILREMAEARAKEKTG